MDIVFLFVQLQSQDTRIGMHKVILMWMTGCAVGSRLFILSAGIGNTTETSYIRAFVALCVGEGFHVAVLNHLGGLDHSPLTGNRIFTYGP